MLHGIDIANWQKGLVIPKDIDFAIMKATGGTGYVDPCCDNWVQQCKKKGVLWGYYHFACDGYNPDPEAEAIFFYRNTKNYTTEGIPILDIEDERIDDWGSYAQRFIDKYHACSGVWPMVYTSASCLTRFFGYPLVDLCGLWIAGYPDSRIRGLGDIPNFPYDVSPWAFAAIWQYSANGRISDYDGDLDINVAFMDEKAWKLYANPAMSGNTSELDLPTGGPEKDTKKWTFENSKIKVDIELK